MCEFHVDDAAGRQIGKKTKQNEYILGLENRAKWDKQTIVIPNHILNAVCSLIISR